MQPKRILMLAILLACLLTVSAVDAAESSSDDIIGMDNQDINEVNETGSALLV